MSALVAKVNELATKAGVKTLTSTLPVWKRWVGGEGEYDVKGLRDVVNSNAIMLDNQKSDVDSLRAEAQDHETRIAALEAQPPARPFP